MCLSALKFHTHTDVQTEPGSPTSRELRLLLTVLRKEFMHVLVAFVPAKLHAPSDLKPKRLGAVKKQPKKSEIHGRSESRIIFMWKTG